MLSTLVNVLVNQKGIFLYSSRGYNTHKSVLGNIGGSKIVDASVCHPCAVFRMEASTPAGCHVSELTGVQ